MALNIKIDNFEGPFDLLLHLIKKNKMDIYDIKIYEITKQYLDYIKEMENMDLEITSEFIVIAATLIEIKSKYLLPKPQIDEIAATENDPRIELVNKLVEYKKYKAAAEYLKNNESSYGMVFSKKPEIIEEESKINYDKLFKNITILRLYNLYSMLMKSYFEKQNSHNPITEDLIIDTFKIEDKMMELQSKIYYKGMYFSNIINECTCKSEIVVTFLALLELIKLKNIKAIQNETFEDIYVERVVNNEST